MIVKVSHRERQVQQAGPLRPVRARAAAVPGGAAGPRRALPLPVYDRAEAAGGGRARAHARPGQVLRRLHQVPAGLRGQCRQTTIDICTSYP